MSKFKSYKRKQIAELREVTANDRVSFERNGYLAVFNDVTPTSTTRVSISEEDLKAGSPKIGDMIARNPKNHADMWLVAQKYFEDNFEEC